eukprot:TRINITY_DN47961_c0_g1_i1.p1 TRINITY_DN47961_c0_g1~~TRINITY_DN47961_c0_g1_i1.p1  ORF type:complete len:127 (+),score=20.92 TRINITY_DN47961_c0_g1_i1:104-484(+)
MATIRDALRLYISCILACSAAGHGVAAPGAVSTADTPRATTQPSSARAELLANWLLPWPDFTAALQGADTADAADGRAVDEDSQAGAKRRLARLLRLPSSIDLAKPKTRGAFLRGTPQVSPAGYQF